MVLPDEDRGEFASLEAALLDELAPDGVLQRILAGRIACAAWRLMRAERLEVELFAEHHIPDGSLGLALIRDGNGTRSFETLLRYRGAAQAELWRALRTLQALQAEAAGHGRARTAEPAPAQVFETNPRQGRTVIARDGEARHPARRAQPNEPETRLEPGEPAPAGPPVQGLEQLTPRPRHLRPNEPDSRRNPRGCDPVTVQRSPGTALAPRQLTVAD